MTTMGFATIGQAPRTDITPDIVAQLPDSVNVLEVGALDSFESADEVEAAVGPVEGQPIYVTRLRDGTSVTVDRSAVIEHLKQRIKEIEADVDTIGVLCTGHFPPFESTVPILEPSELLGAWARAVVDEGTIGVMMPKEEQITQTHEKWDGHEIVAAAGSPYSDEDEVTEAAEQIGNRADLIVMDCMGYTPEMKETVRNITETSVLLGRSVLAKTATELL